MQTTTQATRDRLSSAAPNYLLPAIRGIQASREYYVAMVPLKLVPRVFVFDEEEIPAEFRAQRRLNRARVPEMARYLVTNPKDYVFSSITASVDGAMEFIPAGERQESDVGTLKIPMTSQILINDGQHRRAAIEEALGVASDLGSESLSVVLFQDAGLRRCQQMFADLNRHAIRPTKSLGILYDHRDPFSKLTLDVVEAVPVFAGFTDLEKTTISNRALKLFTLNAIYQSTRRLLGKASKHSEPTTGDERTAVDYWTTVSNSIPEWQLLLQKKVTPAELRRDFVHSHGIVLQALGQAGEALLRLHPKDWKQRVRRLRSVDWRRSNQKMWEGRAMVDGRMSKRQANIDLTAETIRGVFSIRPGKDASVAETPVQA